MMKMIETRLGDCLHLLPPFFLSSLLSSYTKTFLLIFLPDFLNCSFPSPALPFIPFPSPSSFSCVYASFPVFIPFSFILPFCLSFCLLPLQLRFLHPFCFTVKPISSRFPRRSLSRPCNERRI